MKQLSILLFATIAMSASAAHQHNPKKPFTGFSFIAGAGSILGEANLNQEAAGTLSPSESIAHTNNNRISESGATGTVGLGYAHQFQNRLVLAGLFTAGFNYITFEENAYAVASVTPSPPQPTGIMQGKVNSTLRNDFALLFKPGFAFQDTLVYGLIGPRWGNFENTFDNMLTVTENDTPTINLPTQADQSAYHVGLVVGVGLTQKFWPHVLAGIEYQYTAYSNNIATFRTFHSQASTGAGYVAHGSVSDIHTNTLMATVAYQF